MGSSISSNGGIARFRKVWETIQHFMVEWRSGSAGALQAQGRGFKSLLDHHESKEPQRWGSFCVVPSPGIGIRSKRVVVRASNLDRAAVRESAIAELDL